jgi:hypothetical protein
MRLLSFRIWLAGKIKRQKRGGGLRTQAPVQCAEFLTTDLLCRKIHPGEQTIQSPKNDVVVIFRKA